MTGPLEGIRILDLTTVIMGPFTTQILAGLGAEVIKIEPPDGDNMRHVVPMRHRGMGHIYLQLNRGKRSLVLDLKRPKAREVLWRFLPGADVLVTNTRPQAMKRLGLDYGTLGPENPHLIYVNCSGFGPKGPYAGQPAYDDLVQGLSGIPWLMQGYTGGEPGYVPLNLSDRLTGLAGAYAVCAALYAREKTGQGQCVDVSLFESMVHLVLGDHMAGQTFIPPEGPPGYARLLSRHRRPYRTQDGYLCLLIYNDKQWRSFFEAIGEARRFQEDERFMSHTHRAQHIDEVYSFLSEIMKTRTTAEWRRLLDKADIPNNPMNSPSDLLNDPHLKAAGLIEIEEHPSEGPLYVTGTPTSWSGTPCGRLFHAPRLGEHSAELLKEVGYSKEEMRSLEEEGAVFFFRQEQG
jgi:crotonobetainyl-CoA:carnitine CoA-transferase CaiB-like acyl-CoA transferase